MARRSSYVRDSERIEDEYYPLDEDTTSFDEKSSDSLPEMTPLVLLKDVRLTIIGEITGTEYFFGGAGAVQNVDKRDAEIMLMKKSGQCCPGSVGATPYFEIAR